MQIRCKTLLFSQIRCNNDANLLLVPNTSTPSGRCVALSNKIICMWGPLPGYAPAASFTRPQCWEHASCSILMLSRVGAYSNCLDDLRSQRSLGGNPTLFCGAICRLTQAAPCLHPAFVIWYLQVLVEDIDASWRWLHETRLHPRTELKSRQTDLATWAISHPTTLHPAGASKSRHRLRVAGAPATSASLAAGASPAGGVVFGSQAVRPPARSILGHAARAP